MPKFFSPPSFFTPPPPTPPISSRSSTSMQMCLLRVLHKTTRAPPFLEQGPLLAFLWFYRVEGGGGTSLLKQLQLYFLSPFFPHLFSSLLPLFLPPSPSLPACLVFPPTKYPIFPQPRSVILFPRFPPSSYSPSCAADCAPVLSCSLSK